MTLLLSQIVEGDRARKDYGDLSGLKDSLKTLGSIHPLVLSKNADDTYDLIAGGRRFRSAKELGVTELHHGSILEPGKIGFLFVEEVPIDVRKEAELDENLYRLASKWTEDVLLIADVHKAKRDVIGHDWGTRQTADLLGPGYGRTTISKAIRLAKLIREGDKEILSCSTMIDAFTVLIKRKEDYFLAELTKRNMPKAGTSVDMSSFLDSLNLNIGGPRKDMDVIKTGDVIQTNAVLDATFVPGGSAEPVIIPLSKMFFLGDFQSVCATLPPGSFDHIVTDIPYGIDMDNLDTMKNISDVADTHDVAQNVSMMEPFLKEAFRLVRSGGFCVFFYDLDWHEYLQTTAAAVGWRVQRWPLIAHKTSNCQNNAAQYNFTKNYESCMILRRDEKTVLRSQQPSSVWMGDFAAERRLYNNPFAKPFELWKWLYSAIAFSGQSVFDPFCGEMSSCRAAVNCGLQPFGCEISEQHYNRGLHNMKAVYALLHKSNVVFA